MKALELGILRRIAIRTHQGQTRFRFHLDLRESEQQPVEFDLTAVDLMILLHALKTLQARHKIPVPATLRPKGKPVLHVVTPDE